MNMAAGHPEINAARSGTWNSDHRYSEVGKLFACGEDMATSTYLESSAEESPFCDDEKDQCRRAAPPADILAGGWKDILLRNCLNVSEQRILLPAPGVTYFSLLAILGSSLVAVAAFATIASAEASRWTVYSISETGTSVDIPSSIFTAKAGSPDGYGQRFQTSDGRASLTIQSSPNSDNDTPAAFLAKKHPPPHIQYKRITPRFFAVSSYRGDKVWYDRCNFSRRFVHCVLIDYPAKEEHAWDEIVTRISLSLKGD